MAPRQGRPLLFSVAFASLVCKSSCSCSCDNPVFAAMSQPPPVHIVTASYDDPSRERTLRLLTSLLAAVGIVNWLQVYRLYGWYRKWSTYLHKWEHQRAAPVRPDRQLEWLAIQHDFASDGRCVGTSFSTYPNFVKLPSDLFERRFYNNELLPPYPADSWYEAQVKQHGSWRSRFVPIPDDPVALQDLVADLADPDLSAALAGQGVDVASIENWQDVPDTYPGEFDDPDLFSFAEAMPDLPTPNRQDILDAIDADRDRILRQLIRNVDFGLQKDSLLPP